MLPFVRTTHMAHFTYHQKYSLLSTSQWWQLYFFPTITGSTDNQVLLTFCPFNLDNIPQSPSPVSAMHTYADDIKLMYINHSQHKEHKIFVYVLGYSEYLKSIIWNYLKFSSEDMRLKSCIDAFLFVCDCVCFQYSVGL